MPEADRHIVFIKQVDVNFKLLDKVCQRFLIACEKRILVLGKLPFQDLTSIVPSDILSSFLFWHLSAPFLVLDTYLNFVVGVWLR